MNAAQRLDAQAVHHRTPCGAGTLAWRSWGAGKPVVLLHGGSGSWNHWVRNIEALAAHYRVLAVDLPGLGGSAPPPVPFDRTDLPASVAQLAGLVLAGVHELLGDQAPLRLVGFSLGAIVGAHLAALAGPGVAQVVLVGATSMGLRWGGLRGQLRPMPAGLTHARCLELQRQNLSLVMLDRVMPGDQLAPRLQLENILNARIRTHPLASANVLSAALPALEGRLSCIWGERDPYSLPDLALRVAAVRTGLSPGARCHIIRGGGHAVMYERADAFNALALTELRR